LSLFDVEWNPAGFASRLRKALNGRTAYSVWRETGIAQSVMRKYLRGGTTPGVDKVFKLAQLTGVSIEWLVTGQGTMRSGKARPEQDTAPDGIVALTSNVESSARALVRAVYAAGGNPVPHDLRRVLLRRDKYGAGRPDRITEKKMDYPGSEGSGSGSHSMSDNMNPGDFHRVKMLDLAVASRGDVRVERLPFGGHVAFHHEWLERQNLDVAQCVIMQVRDVSMEPTLMKDCLVLVDCAERRRKDGRILVVRNDESLLVRRLERVGENWCMVCDHAQWEDQPWPSGAQVVGTVRWMTRVFS